MVSTVLLLIDAGPGVDWWRAPERRALARLAFSHWWEGLPTVALVVGGSADGLAGAGLPAEAERCFDYRRRPALSPALWFWLRRRGIRRVLLAGPDGSRLAADLARWGFEVAFLGQAPVDAVTPAALPWRLA